MIQVKNIFKEFALEDINLEIKKGELVLISGMSGSGKTTLLNIIASFLKPDSGAVMIDGQNIVSLSDYHLSNYRKNKIGYVTQGFHLFEELSVQENLLSALVIQNLSQKEMQITSDEVLRKAHIFHKAKQKTSLLSGGEKQRVVIARALVSKPKILLCDEPTANLDRENTLLFMQIVEELHESGTTIIIATHDALLENLKEIGQNISLKDGKIV